MPPQPPVNPRPTPPPVPDLPTRGPGSAQPVPPTPTPPPPHMMEVFPARSALAPGPGSSFRPPTGQQLAQVRAQLPTAPVSPPTPPAPTPTPRPPQPRAPSRAPTGSGTLGLAALEALHFVVAQESRGLRDLGGGGGRGTGALPLGFGIAAPAPAVGRLLSVAPTAPALPPPPRNVPGGAIVSPDP